MKIDNTWNQIGVVIPVFFMLAGMAKLNLLPGSISGYLANGLSYIWPFAHQHYDVLVSLNRPAEANNYILCYFVVTLFCSFVILRTLLLYFSQRPNLKTAGPNELVLILIFLGVGVPGVIFDRASAESCHSIYDTCFDKLGLYFLRQYAITFVIQLGLQLLLISILRGSKKTAISPAPEHGS